jgi:hypothetical protein
MASDAPNLTREQALAAKPVATKILKRETIDGGERITVRFEPSAWQRWLLRIPDTATRRYDLDALGLEVLGMCDGQKSVRYIIDRFAKRHQVSAGEAERAVTMFLQTMIRKGIVSMVVE